MTILGIVRNMVSHNYDLWRKMATAFMEHLPVGGSLWGFKSADAN